jgi:uncharacterized protein
VSAIRHVPHPDGLELQVSSASLVCRHSGALWLERERALIVADLHFEKGSSYARRGQMLPPFDTGETLSRLESDVDALSPRMIVFLGDSFHDAEAESRLCDRDVRRIAALSAARTLIWVVGNHDIDGPRTLAGDIAASLAIGPFTFVHEPAPGPAPGEIAGHLHPCARVRAQGASVRRRCFVTDGQRLILPAFGAYAGGLNVRDPVFARHLAQAPLAAVLGVRKVHAVGWRSLRGD